jgi:hypothetical protein
MIVFICVLIITAVTLFMPWYNINGKIEMDAMGNEMKMELNIDMHLQEVKNETTYTIDIMGTSQSVSESGSDDYSDEEDIETPMNITYYLTLISVILCILVVILVGIAIFGFLSPKIALSIGIIAMLLILVAMVYFPIGLPNGLKKDFDKDKADAQAIGLDYDGSFMGSSENTTDFMGVEGKTKWSWGPGMGWFFIIVSFVMAIIGISLIARAGKGASRPYPARPRGYPEQPPIPPPPQQPPPPRRDYYDDRSRGQYYDQKPRDRGYDSGYRDDRDRY